LQPQTLIVRSSAAGKNKVWLPDQARKGIVCVCVSWIRSGSDFGIPGEMPCAKNKRQIRYILKNYTYGKPRIQYQPDPDRTNCRVAVHHCAGRGVPYLFRDVLSAFGTCEDGVVFQLRVPGLRTKGAVREPPPAGMVVDNTGVWCHHLHYLRSDRDGDTESRADHRSLS